MQKSVSLIISFYNKIDILKLIFAALENQTCRDFEVVIADDGSRPEVVLELKSLISESSFQVKHIWHEDIGWRKNTILNKSVVASESDFIIFIDGDCIPHTFFIQEHLESKKSNQVVCGRRVTLTKKITERVNLDKVRSNNFHSSLFYQLLIPSVFCESKTRIMHMIRVRNKTIRRFFVKDKQKGILGCNFSICKDDLMKVNGFDERFVYPGMGEDSDLENRLRNNGAILVSKKYYVTVYHMFHKDLGPFNEKNIELYNDNFVNKVTYTQNGLNKYIKT
jgi:glycosyltransferase involved in cell wall biosynthesis